MDAEARSKEIRASAQKLLSADHFDALGVARTASAEDVKTAFLERVKTWHPDRIERGHEDERPLFAKVFARLEVARATLSDPARRAKYVVEGAKPHVRATDEDLSSAEAALELRKADALLKKNDNAAAEKHLQRVLGLDPGNVEAQALLVWVQVKPDSTPERLRELVATLDHAIGRECTSDRAYFFRGQLRKRLDLSREARADFVKAAALNPKNVDAVREVRIYAMREQNAESAAAQEGSGAFGFVKKLFKR